MWRDETEDIPICRHSALAFICWFLNCFLKLYLCLHYLAPHLQPFSWMAGKYFPFFINSMFDLLPLKTRGCGPSVALMDLVMMMKVSGRCWKQWGVECWEWGVKCFKRVCSAHQPVEAVRTGGGRSPGANKDVEKVCLSVCICAWSVPRWSGFTPPFPRSTWGLSAERRRCNDGGHELFISSHSAAGPSVWTHLSVSVYPL